MSDFDPATSYLLDHELLDFVETAVWEQQLPLGVDPIRTDGFFARTEDINHPDYLSLTVGIGITPTTTVFVCWPPIPDSAEGAVAFDPRPGHVLIVGDDQTRWVIQSHRRQAVGRWVVACDIEPTNVDT